MRKKRFFKTILCLFFVFLTAICAFGIYLFSPSRQAIDKSKLIKSSSSIQYLSASEKIIELGTKANERADIDSLPSYVKNAFIAVEDKRFYKHNGVDIRGMLRALKNNILSKSVKEGGSTITQQLIKNTHLTSEKTLSRKISEIKLALKMEKNYSKDEILSFYLNSIYFGEGCYGIEQASKNYFAKSARDLTISEAAALASTVKAPSVYNPKKSGCDSRKNSVLKLMYEQGYISESEYLASKKEKIITKQSKDNEYLAVCEEELFDILQISPYSTNQIKVITYLDEGAQTALTATLKDKNQGGIIMSKYGKIKAYKIPEGDIDRPPASVIKPILVYAPAIEEGVVHLATKILDEPTNFSGYTPSNYANKYYGWVSVKEAISKSLNVPAVKVLDALGSEKAQLYARKLNIDIKENSLNIALGSYNGGVNLKTLCASYTPFLSNGYHFKPTSIKEIYIDKKLVYKDSAQGEKVFSLGTCEIINEALKECSISGTARAIGKKNYEVCAKTGTCGNEKGNTDAYTLCYTSQDIIALRFCNADNSLMPNNLTGGEVAKYSNKVLDLIYKDEYPTPFLKSDEVTYVNISKLAYQEGRIEIADELLPKRFIIETPVLTKYIKSLPISSLSTLSLDCKIEVIGNKIVFYIDKNKDFFYKIEMLNGGKFIEIATSNQDVFELSNLYDGDYIFKITPFIKLDEGENYYGKEKLLPIIKIESESDFINSPWWEE